MIQTMTIFCTFLVDMLRQGKILAEWKIVIVILLLFQVGSGFFRTYFLGSTCDFRLQIQVQIPIHVCHHKNVRFSQKYF